MAHIEEFRRDQERFHETLHRALLEFYAGRGSKLRIAGIYADYSDLFNPGSIQDLKSAIEQTSDSFPSRRKSLDRAHRFAIEQFLDSRAAPMEEEIASGETAGSFPWNGAEVAFARIPALLASESNPVRRRELQRIRVRRLRETEEVRIRRLEEIQSAARRLGYGSSLQALEAAAGLDYSSLSVITELLLAATEPAYQERLGESFGMVTGTEPGQAMAYESGYWELQNEPAGPFRAELLRPAFAETFKAAGLEPEAAISYDLEPRAAKPAGFMCIPVLIPQEVYVLGARAGARTDFACLLHEGGHAHHFAWTSAALASEFRLSGDRGLCEAFGFLFEQLTTDESWLIENLGYFRPQPYLRFQALHRCYRVRREIGRLRFAVSLYGSGGVRDAGERYAEIMREHTALRHDPEMWASDGVEGFRCADYLRGWMLAAMLGDHLRMRFGTAWHRSRPAGNLLKEIWETGQLYTADELARDLGLGKLDPQNLGDELQRGLGL